MSSATLHTGGDAVLDAAAEAVVVGDPSLYFDQHGNNNRIDIRYRDDELIASEFVLFSVLDGRFDGRPGRFLDQLAETHWTISS